MKRFFTKREEKEKKIRIKAMIARDRKKKTKFKK